MSDDDKLRNSLRAGHQLHWYQIEKVLGQGGFGITYLAYDTNLDQHVAIKEYLPMELAVREGDFSVYPASQAQDSRYQWGLDRFLTEARTLARFKHPAIVRVLSVFEANNTAYMVMEYQQGASLQQILDQRRTLPEADLVAMVVPLLDGLEIIHAQGFIHRDIKPSNLFIHDDGHPVLLDFGSARQALGEETRTLTSVVSPGYAPFEQYYSKSDRQGPWTDIYGLGATLYRCLSGLQPMAAIDRSEAILRAERDVFVSATELGRGQYSNSFLAAVDIALLFNETKRPQTVAEWRPYFDFSTSTERAARDALHTRYPDDAPTRFSALAEPAPEVAGTVVQNPDARSERRSAERVSARHSRDATSGEATRSRSRSRAPDEATVASSRREASVRHDTERLSRQVSTEPPPAPRRRLWPVLLVLVLGLAGATGYGVYSGLIPARLWSGNDVARLVAQGDRALAAGKLLLPRNTSALAFYQRAFVLDPTDVDARHGLRLAGEGLVSEVAAAVTAGDHERVAVLDALVGDFPAGVVDLEATRALLEQARTDAVAAARDQERIEAFLRAADADIERGQLVGSGTDNALARFRAAQVLDPDNPGARAGLSRLALAIAERGQAALAGGDLESALEWHGQASLIDADAAAVAALGIELDAARRAAASEQDREAQLSQLLAAAATDLEANRLTTPAGNNALERYRQVAEIEPGNAAAAAGVRRIHDRYIAMATQALARDDFDAAAQLARKAQSVTPDSEPAQALQRELAEARARAVAQERELAAAAARAQAEQAAAARAAQERARRAADADRRRQAEAEAARLLAVAEARAAAEKAAREAAAQAELDALNAEPRIVVDFLGFHPKYARDGLTRDNIFRQVAPLIRAAGYEIVTRGQVHDAQYQWTNVKLLAYRLNVNENTATGQYSYAGSVNLLQDATLRLSLAEALESRPTWSRSKNGLGPPTDLRKLADQYVEMTRAFLEKRPGRRR